MKTAESCPLTIDPRPFSAVIPHSARQLGRRLHALRGWLSLLLATRGELFAHGAAFLVDSLPVPVCLSLICINANEQSRYRYEIGQSLQTFGQPLQT